MISQICFRRGVLCSVEHVTRQIRVLFPLKREYSRGEKRHADSQQQLTEKSQMRDLINFPRPVKLSKSPPVCLGFIPKYWFDFLYEKTGVTGPYMLGAGVLTYMLSKEIYVINGETGASIAFATFLFVLNRYIPELGEMINKCVTEATEEMDSSQQKEKDDIKEAIAGLEKFIWQCESIKMLADAKRENVYLQMEGEYRQRLAIVHATVKNQLNYLAEKEAIERRYVNSNFMSWVLEEVANSITPAIVQAALTQSIADLKTLASRLS